MRKARGDVCNTEAGAADRLVAAAQASDWKEVERLLVQGIDANCRDVCGRTPLIAASTFREGDLKAREFTAHMVVRTLLEYGADPDLADNQGETPLMVAAKYDHWMSLQTLVTWGADASRKDRAGRTAFTWAAGAGMNDQALQLLRSNGESLILIDAALLEDWTALHQILSRGGDVDAIDSRGNTALMVAADCGNLQAIEALLAHHASTRARNGRG